MLRRFTQDEAPEACADTVATDKNQTKSTKLTSCQIAGQAPSQKHTASELSKVAKDV
jgi:hypothetical protein